ncbi:hypothetical protein EI427_17040 [Flammeovirga pectinis]|uniref:DUF4412 domain-containing protein n=1 Tax=Flammeovirga pectinis TaxID=2494373 RepID=A0A3Q9FNZ3_9BACT|nr:DUF6263 family protein [Flammeovirga pectinis]AZQ63869.1 hypothetical protein EI427_17040 [Flammeovirga pectinis]
MKRFFNVLFIMLLMMMNAHAQKVDLSLKLQKGNNYNQNSISNVVINQTVNGQSMTINMDNESKSVFHVKEVKENIYIMDVYYTELEVGIQMGPEMQTFSSTKSEDPFSTILSAMISKRFEVQINTKGKVIAVEGMDNVWEQVLAETQDIPAMQKEQVIAQLKQSYGEKNLTTNIESITAIYPSEIVKKGSTWQTKYALDNVIKAEVATEFTMASVSKTEVILEGKSTITTDPNNKEFTMTNGMLTRFDGEGTMTSTYHLNRSNGWISKCIINQEIKGDTYVKAQGQEMKIPQTISTFIQVDDKTEVE